MKSWRLVLVACFLSTVLFRPVFGARKSSDDKVLPIVFYAAYVFHASPDGDILTYRWPENYTAVLVLDKMARNTAELVETLRQTYAFRKYSLLKSFAAMQVFEPDGKTVVWAGVHAAEPIELKGDKIGVRLQAPFPPEKEEAPFQLAVSAHDWDKRKIIFQVAVVGKSGKTVVVGDQFPPPPVYGIGPREALFVAVTPFPVVLRKPSDLKRCADVLKRVRDMAPGSTETGPIEEDGLWRSLVSEARKVWGSEITTPRVAERTFVEPAVRMSVSFGAKAQVGKKPSKPEKGTPVFAPYDFPPEPVGGFAAIQGHLRYPESARKEGIEGRVIVHVCVDENGDVVDTKILKSLRKDLDEAAIEAVRAVKWRPALQRNIPVKVWVAIPVIFRLKKEAPKVVPKEVVLSAKKGTPAYTAYDSPPEPVGGFEAIQRQLSKEMVHRCAPVRVIIWALINEKGGVDSTKVLKSSGTEQCDNAAQNAVRAVRWKPALQKGKPVKVWVALPVVFKEKK
ncbi:MAG: energy transducer TonB [Calditrichaeota bacterium]|nr:energy transducer TonB [Calditrichota bacterium]